MKRISTRLGLLSITLSIIFASCVSNGKVMTTSPSQADVMSRMKKMIADSIVNFNNGADGSIYVSVQGKMLFKPGSATVDSKGQKALRPLAELLYEENDFTMMIKGTTDTVATKKAKYANSWTLSEARATSIMNILTETARERTAALQAAEQKASLKKTKVKNEAMDAQNTPADEPTQAENKKYILVLVNSL